MPALIVFWRALTDDCGGAPRDRARVRRVLIKRRVHEDDLAVITRRGVFVAFGVPRPGCARRRPSARPSARDEARALAKMRTDIRRACGFEVPVHAVDGDPRLRSVTMLSRAIDATPAARLDRTAIHTVANALLNAPTHATPPAPRKRPTLRLIVAR